MNFDRKLLCLIAIACSIFSAVTCSSFAQETEEAKELGYSIWNPGTTYKVNVQYMIRLDAKDGGTFEIKPKSTAKEGMKFYGAYQVPSLTFMPVVEFMTDDIVSDGGNYFGRRQYAQSSIRVDGVKDIKWKSDKAWYNPKRWGAAWRRGRDKDIKKWQIEVENEIAAINKNGGKIERNPIFADKNHKVVDFDIERDCLFFRWDDTSIAEYLRDGGMGIDVWKELKLDEKGYSTSRFVDKYRSNVPPEKAHDIIRDSIRSECNATLFAVLRGTPGEEIGRPIEIDAKRLNGLLVSKSLQEMFVFDGVLEVIPYKLKKPDCEAKGFNPFGGMKLKVRDSRHAKVAFDAGHGYQKHDLTFSLDSTNNYAELWFDFKNQTIRYAHVRLEIPDYKGNIPVPTYAEMLSTLSGTASGRITVECEYKTFIGEMLYYLPEEEQE